MEWIPVCTGITTTSIRTIKIALVGGEIEENKTGEDFFEFHVTLLIFNEYPRLVLFGVVFGPYAFSPFDDDFLGKMF